MENSSKALLIAAGVLMAILVVSVAIMGYNQISNSSKAQQEALAAEQIVKFNKQFDNYNREDIMGIELVSLLNKINDYNSKYVPEGYTAISNNIESLIEYNNGKITSEFKGKKFKCTKVTYDKKNGRVIEMTFEKQ